MSHSSISTCRFSNSSPFTPGNVSVAFQIGFCVGADTSVRSTWPLYLKDFVPKIRSVGRVCMCSRVCDKCACKWDEKFYSLFQSTQSGGGFTIANTAFLEVFSLPLSSHSFCMCDFSLAVNWANLENFEARKYVLVYQTRNSNQNKNTN